MPGKECIRAALDWAETSAKALGFFTGLNGAVIMLGSLMSIPLTLSQADLVEDEDSMEDDSEFDKAIKLKEEDLGIGAPNANASQNNSKSNLVDEEKKNNSKLSIDDGEFDGAIGMEESKEDVPPEENKEAA